MFLAVVIVGWAAAHAAVDISRYYTEVLSECNTTLSGNTLLYFVLPSPTIYICTYLYIEILEKQ